MSRLLLCGQVHLKPAYGRAQDLRLVRDPSPVHTNARLFAVVASRHVLFTTN